MMFSTDITGMKIDLCVSAGIYCTKPASLKITEVKRFRTGN